MRLQHQHPWHVTPGEAQQIQRRLSSLIETSDRLTQINRVAGVDVGFEDQGSITRAAVSLLEYPSLQPLEESVARLPTRFPYIPGLLSFREIPAVLKALDKLATAPQLLLCDGQGIAHPRRFGLACHLGLLTDIPAIGVAKTRLIGEHPPLAESKGSWVPLMHRGERVGAVLRSRDRVSPLYISVGHRIYLETAIAYVLGCITRFRLPETTRRAHRLASG